MGTRIEYRKNATSLLPYEAELSRFLPPRLISEIKAADESSRLGGGISRSIEEIRLRRGMRAALTVGGKNLLLHTVISGDEIDMIMSSLCENSLYAYSDSIKQGFISVRGGIRVGVVGVAATEDGAIIGVSRVNGLNIRIPRAVRYAGMAKELSELVMRGDSILIYSPPGVGKTTLLRRLAELSSSGKDAKRVAVIDSRRELFLGDVSPDHTLDVLSGYPRGLGIEIATRTMGAELIVCDEIGGVEEAESIMSAQNCGVPLIASAHGRDIESLLRREGIARLHRARIFDYYAGLSRGGHIGQQGGISEFHFKLTDWEEADDILQGNRGGTACGKRDISRAYVE